jgi:hypothetical protein
MRTGERATITVHVDAPGSYHLLAAGANGTLQRVPGATYRLRRGANRIPVVSPGLVDALVLHPATARTSLRLADQRNVELSWRLDEGRLRIAETPA